MSCPGCGSIKSRVQETRVVQIGWVRRRRICGCDHRWYTYEVPAEILEADLGPDDLKEIDRKKKS